MQILLYIVGFLVFILGQLQNSLMSTANSLEGWAGALRWLKMQIVNLVIRGFFAGMFYGYIVHQVTAKLLAVNFALQTWAIAGVAGFAANALLWQIFGLIPWLRVEVPNLAPPANPIGVGIPVKMQQPSIENPGGH
jgi:hypothetical protein